MSIAEKAKHYLYSDDGDPAAFGVSAPLGAMIKSLEAELISVKPADSINNGALHALVLLMKQLMSARSAPPALSHRRNSTERTGFGRQDQISDVWLVHSRSIRPTLRLFGIRTTIFRRLLPAAGLDVD
jgi:hypothetical protein